MGRIQPTFIGVIIHLLSTMDIPAGCWPDLLSSYLYIYIYYIYIDLRTEWLPTFENHLVPSAVVTRRAPTSYKWSYNPYKWPCKWVTGVNKPYF